MVKPMVILIALFVATGCQSYRPTAPLPAPETTVRVSFLAPRDVVARTATGDSILLAGVKEIRGSVVRSPLDTRTDMMRVRVGTANGTSGALTGVPSGAIAMIPREMFARVEQRSLDPVKTLKVVGYVAAGVLALSLLAIGLALDD